MSAQRSEPESTYAWLRLGAALAVMTIGGSGMYAMAVALAPVQAEFGVTRGDASLPYTLTMLGFGIGGIVMGRLADRFGVVVPMTIGALGIGSGFILAGNASTLLQFSVAHGLLIGFLGCSSTFAPLVADTSLWFTRRRGIAVAICASGNYSGRRGLAADPAIPLRHRRLARHLHRNGNFLHGHHAAVRARAAPAAPGAGNFHEREPDRAERKAAWPRAQYPHDPAHRRRHRLLRGDVDAAGSHRRVLRRPRLRRGARRRDAVDHAGLRHRQPPALRAGSATASAGCAPCSSARSCRASRCCCSCRSTA